MSFLCNIFEIDDPGALGLEYHGDALFAVKKDEELHLYRNSCPHLGVELEWLENQFLDANRTLIQCSTHGALFIIESGECVAGPCQGASLQAVPFEVVDGELHIR